MGIRSKILISVAVPVIASIIAAVIITRAIINSEIRSLLERDVNKLVSEQIELIQNDVGKALKEQGQSSRTKLAGNFQARVEGIAAELAEAALPLAESFDNDGIGRMVTGKMSSLPILAMVRVFTDRSGRPTVKKGAEEPGGLLAVKEKTSGFAYVKVEVLARRTELNQAMAEDQKSFAQIEERVAGAKAAIGAAMEKAGEELRNRVAETLNARLGMFFLVVVIILLGLLSIVLNRLVITPIHRLVAVVKRIENREYEVNVEVKSNDEIGYLGRNISEMASNLGAVARDLCEGVSNLVEASRQLNELSRTMSTQAEHASAMANLVADEASGMNRSMESAATAMEQSSVTSNSVAAAAEQMVSSVGEVARCSELARSLTQQAVQELKTTSGRVDSLNELVIQVDKIMDTISLISEQTKLLSLNAAIEAARAGEAGKGFAVVANEVKNLADQTSSSTEEINRQLQEVKRATAGTVAGIQSLVKSIREVEQTTVTTAAASEEQAVSTNEICANIGQVSKGLTEVTTRVAEVSDLSRNMLGEIDEVRNASGSIAQASAEVGASAGQISAIADRLQSLANRI